MGFMPDDAAPENLPLATNAHAGTTRSLMSLPLAKEFPPPMNWRSDARTVGISLPTVTRLTNVVGASGKI